MAKEKNTEPITDDNHNKAQIKNQWVIKTHQLKLNHDKITDKIKNNM